MKQINVVTLKNVHSNRDRIGDNKRSIQSEGSLKIEELLLNTPSPLPLTFDIRPIHDYYFNEFTYHDIFGGLVVNTMSPEISARILDQIFYDEEVKDITDHCKILTEIIFDKYQQEQVSMPEVKKIAFLPGSNLMNAVDKELLDRLMFNDDTVCIKLHPITSDDMVRQLGIKYGYHRLLSPHESGINYLIQASEVYATANSEIGIYAAALGKMSADITSFECMAELTYWTLIRLFVPGQIEHNKQVINKVLSSRGSGWLMPWMKDIEERIPEYYNRAMKLRAFFKPLAPKVNRNRLKSYPVQEKNPNHPTLPPNFPPQPKFKEIQKE